MTTSNTNSTQFYIENYLPHNFLAEKIVLSSLLISNEAIEITLNNLEIQAFYFKNHQEIYKAILTLYKKTAIIDLITLITFLQDNGLLEKIGGMKVINELIIEIPNLGYLKEYIRLLQDKFLRRTLIKLGYSIVNSSYITNIPLENIFNDLETQLFELKNETQKKETLNSTDLFSKIFLDLKQKSSNPSLTGISSGFYDLDSLTQGFQKSDLIIIAGRPSMGKTAFSLHIAINIIKNYKLPVLFFSLEMSKEQLIYRLLANEIEITNTRLRSGNLNKKDWLKLNTSIKMMSCLPLFIDDSVLISITDIRSKIKKLLFEETNLGLIIIDYLQLMQQFKFSTDNRAQELSQITRSLKSIAREFNVPVIALSQLSRNVENRINKRPILSDLRESGAIEQDADLVLMLYREKYYTLEEYKTDILELIIAKHRNGPIGTVNLLFNPVYTKFANLNTNL
uniref:Replicative DNA helicase n=1 Tax=Actinocyclus subtilis TaxID=1630683 RepID=A0A2U9NQ20_9STRA|nr:DNA replication helicase [Actinocyclus subtilis]AWT39220.1 DNA replication helicase [Actinocyclus subtilis]